jgi:hypothetical protein
MRLSPLDHPQVAVEAGVCRDLRVKEVAGNSAAAAPYVEQSCPRFEHFMLLSARAI